MLPFFPYKKMPIFIGNKDTKGGERKKKSFYTITKGTALEQHIKLPRIANAMACKKPA